MSDFNVFLGQLKLLCQTNKSRFILLALGKYINLNLVNTCIFEIRVKNVKVKVNLWINFFWVKKPHNLMKKNALVHQLIRRLQVWKKNKESCCESILLYIYIQIMLDHCQKWSSKHNYNCRLVVRWSHIVIVYSLWLLTCQSCISKGQLWQVIKGWWFDVKDVKMKGIRLKYKKKNLWYYTQLY